MSGRRSRKTLIITDDEVVQEEQNPFSFREFLRWKNLNRDQDQDQDQVQDQDQNQDQVQDQDKTQSKEEEGQGFQCGVDSTSSLCTEEEEDEEEETRFQQGGDDETCRGRSHIQQLKQENMVLRRTIEELQRRSDVNERRVQKLSEERLQRRSQDEKEAQDLETMIHCVEQNLQLMTKRAVKAENTVSKLKAELQQLQVEAESLRVENDGLKASESHIITTMRQNAQVASEHLDKTASHAHSSIRQLLGGAESLRLVSQLLQSIENVSSVDSES
ncbi:endosome-associated-trafficking regulator 1 [Scophthalmus maximus]|uniref:endosome-associated-trafficking regulator 1 n=1 Tax=Scophthalmus maximus TaxID=52904 RepID=UPI000F345D74|nr:endosome-associated-trafficking regulator 1 [Scophthalmus maximus]